MKNKLDIKVTVKDNQIKILINGIIHLLIKQDQLIGVQSWILGNDHNTYWIEYTLKDREILTGYDEFDKWKTILKLLDEQNLCGGKF